MTVPVDIDSLRASVLRARAAALNLPHEGWTPGMRWEAAHAEPGPWTWLQPGPTREDST